MAAARTPPKRKAAPTPKPTSRPAPKSAAKPTPPALQSAKRLAHRPPYLPNEEHRRTVEAMTAYGIDQEKVSVVLGITAKTLRRHYRKELDAALIKAVAQIAASLFNRAKGGDVNAMKFYLTCRAPKEWSERVTVVDGAAEVDPRLLTDAELEARVTKLRRAPSVIRALRTEGIVH